MRRVQAQLLQPGDRVGTGETVIRVERGLRTPAGKVEVFLRRDDQAVFVANWGARTMINVRDAEGR